MKLKELLNDVKYEVLNGTLDVNIEHLTIDSREVAAGSLFVCVKGLSVDRHEFINKAFEKGAAAVIAEKNLSSYPIGLTVVKVDNARLELTKIASEFYGNPAQKMRIIGVTGTNGKTSVSTYLAQILTMNGKSTGLIGTTGIKLNGEPVDIPFATSTSPDTIELNKIFLQLKNCGAEFVVMEVSSHALELYKLDGVFFEVGIFTNLTQDHLDFHKTMENYRNAKAKLFRLCKRGVINSDDDAADYIVSTSCCDISTYSIEKESSLKAEDVSFTNGGVSFRIGETNISAPVAGKFNIYNLLGTIGAALALGLTPENIKDCIARLKGVPGRIEKLDTSLNFGIYIDYAHSPDSLYNILKSVRDFTRNKVIVVFGCGGDRDRLKRPIMGKIAGELADYCIITSDNPRSENPESIIEEIASGVAGCGYECITDRKEAVFRAVSLASEGDSVIIAGKGHEDYQELADRTIRFDDKETALFAVKAVESSV